ncbi:glycoside hydrolase family 3 protein [Calditrichota bacterium GD2]
MRKYEKIFKQMTLEEKIGQMFMIGFSGETLPEDVKEFIDQSNIGFIDIFARNISSVEQATKLMNAIHASGKIPPMIFTDQEGGIVCQFAELTSTFANHMGMAATGNVAFTKMAAEILAEDMDLIGIDGFIAPTIDVNYEPDNPIIGLRAFSDDVDTVTAHGKAFIEGVEQTGLAAMPKHFPGHGGSRLDSHLVLPSLDCSEEYFTNMNLIPFKKVVPISEFMMTAHIAVPQIDATGLPATFSQKFLKDILRSQLKFDGVLITDCLEMDVIKNNFSPEEIVQYSIDADVDVLLLSHSLDLQKELYDILLSKVKRGEVPEQRIDRSVKRILRAKEKFNLLTEHKQRSVELAKERVRSKRDIEDFVCKHSIVLLRDRLNKIPLRRKDIKLGIIEWDKTRSTIQLHEPSHNSYLEEQAKKYFKNVEVLLLPLKKPEFSEVKEFLKRHDEVLVGPFSRTPEVEKLQADVIRNIMRIRNDVIIVATGNPYDIRYFPEANTYLATFGFRECQINAFFEVLVGNFKPSGRLPVEIKNVFPRWHNWSCND